MKSIKLLGSGFIGDRLALLLVKKGYQVDIADLKYGNDIRDREATRKMIKEFPGDKVILMAAVSNLNIFEAEPWNGLDVNMGGLINVVMACVENKKKLYYISTCCVYGNTKDLPSSEEARPDPSEIYAACKLAGEWIIKGLHKSFDLEYVILRIATTYGVGMRAALAPAVFINQVLKGKPITIHGDGKQTRTLTYIDDEVEGIAAVVLSDAINDTFNISTEEEQDVNYLAKVICEEMGEPNHKIIHIENRKGQTYKEKIDAAKMTKLRVWEGRYAPDPSKVNGNIGWKAKVSLRKGIGLTLKWMADNKLKQIK